MWHFKLDKCHILVRRSFDNSARHCPMETWNLSLSLSGFCNSSSSSSSNWHLNKNNSRNKTSVRGSEGAETRGSYERQVAMKWIDHFVHFFKICLDCPLWKVVKISVQEWNTVLPWRLSKGCWNPSSQARCSSYPIMIVVCSVHPDPPFAHGLARESWPRQWLIKVAKNVQFRCRLMNSEEGKNTHRSLHDLARWSWMPLFANREPFFIGSVA